MTPADLARLTELRHDLHRQPELSGQEARTAARVAAHLNDLQPDHLLTGIGGHGVAAVFQGAHPGPTVAVRCELDGLPIQELSERDHRSQVPGRGHLCGHDGHMVTVLAVGETLARARPVRGRAVLIFQPAEETGKGAAAFRADPQFASIAPDMVFSLHNLPGLPLGHVELATGAANCASRGMRIRLTGKTAHAAAPGDGLSPAAAIARLLPELAALGPGGALTEGFSLTTVTHAWLGEPTFGVAPGAGEVWVTLRTVGDAAMARLAARAHALAETAAGEAGLGLEIGFDDVFEACTNAPAPVEILQAACAARDVPLYLSDRPQSFSEDFGQFAKGAETAMFWLGAGEDHPRLHNPDYDFPDALILIGADVFETAMRSVLG